jgi:hypothetical protein
MSNEVFVASKEKPKNGYGQNGYQGASSVTTKAKQPKMGDIIPETTATPNINQKWDDQRMAQIQGHPLKPAHAMRSRQNSGEKVPSANRQSDFGTGQK